MTPVSGSSSPRIGRSVTRFLLRLVRPLIALSYVAGAPTRMSAGAPRDESNGLIEGPRPLSILVAGGLSGASVGVHSHQLGVAHQFALQLARQTGRGVEWEALSGGNQRLASTANALCGLAGIASFDAIVVSPGTADILAFASLSNWRADLARLIESVHRDGSPNVDLIVTEVPDVSGHVQVNQFVSALLSEDARTFTEAAAGVCAASGRARFVALPEVETFDFVDGAFSYSRLYRRWGHFLGDLVAAQLV